MITVPLSTALGLSIFTTMMGAAVFLYWVDQTHRTNFSLPYGNSIPYSLAVVGAGTYFVADQGLVGLAGALATAIFVGAAVKYTNLLKDVE